MNTAQAYVIASRPKTLIAGICPVLLGSLPAIETGQFNFPLFMVTLLAALSVQIGCNFTNDYADFQKGADTRFRKGPMRATQAGLISPEKMKQGAIICFLITAILSLILVIKGGVAIALLALFCIAAAYFYTAGPYPLAYYGLGELFVFLFYALLAAPATYYLQTGIWNQQVALIGMGPGLFSCAILCINNLRDIEEDRLASKRTLAVIFGKQFAKIEYGVLLFIASLSSLFFAKEHPYVAFATFTLTPSILLIKEVFAANRTEDLIPLFPRTIRLQLIYTALFAIGYFL